jgi:hypothetical protein
MTLAAAVDLQNRFMAGFDLALGSAALTAAEATLRLLGHHQPSEDAVHLFEALRADLAHLRGRPRGGRRAGHGKDWWALAWLRGSDVATDAVWARSPAFRRPGVRAVMTSVGLANLAMTVAFGARGRGGRR